MDDVNGLYERYLEVYDEEEEDDKLMEKFNDEFLRDEMEELLINLDVELESDWLKEDMAYQLLSIELYERVKDIVGEDSEEEKETVKDEAKGEDIFTPTKLFGDFDIGAPKYIKKFWKEMQKEAGKNLKDLKISPEKYWIEIEKMWEEQSQVVKKNIEMLAKKGLPEEDVERLKKEWEDFSEEMNFHLKEIPLELEVKRESIGDIIEEHTEESRKIMAEPDRKLRDLYPLWFDMIKEVREELEDARDRLEDKEEALSDTWDEFSESISQELRELAEENEEAKKVLEKWELISSELDKKMSKIPEKHDDIYKEFWENLGRKRPKLAKKIEEFTEMTEKDYMERIENVLEPIRSTYEKMMKPKEKDQKEEIKELKERISELEKKLEEK
ncbi:MAG: hypothetical protein KGY66_00910 [Candidatus Thermoplasmatota archaeon]|nr:hypothetical protein [Candidatus Thermoplasmatota archaeon]